MTIEADLQLGGLSIWVDERQFPDSRDYYDANWLMVRARMEASGAIVTCGGPILMTADIDSFRLELETLRASLAGNATLSSHEPELKATLTMHSLGRVEGEVEITSDHLNQFHRFSFELDQSYLPALIAACEAILERFPVVGVP